VLGIEFEDASGIEQIWNVNWVNVYTNDGKPLAAIRIVNGEVEIYQFDQGGE